MSYINKENFKAEVGKETIEKNFIEIGNEFISRKFETSNNHFKPASITNKKIWDSEAETNVTLLPSNGSEEFIIGVIGKFRSKFEIKASMLTIDKINEFEKDGAALIEVNFKTAVVKKAEFKIRAIYVLLENDCYIKKQLYISANGNKELKIDYIDTESLVLKDGIMQKWSHPNMDKAFLDGFHASLGQPVYVNGMFFGSHFPMNDNNIVNDRVRIRYYCGKKLSELLNDREEYSLHTTVVGSTQSLEYDLIRAEFLKYIESISQKTYLRTQYNSWYDHMLDISEENINTSFYEIEKGLTQHGVAPLDSYVVDDGWTDYSKDFWCFNEKFPNEFYNSALLSKSFSSSFGMWLGPRGGYNKETMPFAKRMEKAKKGGYNKQSKDICVSDKNYLNNIEALFIDYMNRFDINYFKLDGFMLKPCKSKKHGHPTGGYKGMYALTDAWENWISIFEKMRENREEKGKSLWINLTCYAVPSPWFLQWVNSIWMQNSDDIGFCDKSLSGEELNGKDFDKMLTYRDSLYYDFHKKRMYQFPNSNMYNHEPIYGNTAKISMTDEEFRNYMYMISSRGTAFWELYYSYNLFNENKWKINADVLKFIKENYHILKNSKLIGEPANTGKIYGYSAWTDSEGIISLRNPSNKKQSYSLKLEKSIGVNESIQALTRVNVIPYCTKPCETLYSFGDTLEIELDAHEIVVFKFSKPEAEAPKLISFKTISKNEIELCFDKHIVISADSFKYENTSLNCELQADYSSVKLIFENEIPNGDICIEYSVNDFYGNELTGAQIVNNYKDGIITASADEPKEINGEFTLSLKVNSTIKDSMIFSQGNALAISLSNGKIRFNCCTLKAVSNDDVCDGTDKNITLVREKNGMIKIYIDSILSGSAYDEKIINPTIVAAPIKQSNSVKSFIIRDKALAFDEV